jgi:hypothetical protein
LRVPPRIGSTPAHGIITRTVSTFVSAHLAAALSRSACVIPYESASAKPMVVGNGLMAAAAITFTRRAFCDGNTTAIATTETIAMTTAIATVKKVR